MVTAVVACAIGAAAGCGILLLLSGLAGHTRAGSGDEANGGTVVRPFPSRPGVLRVVKARDAGIALVVGLAALAVTRWPMGFVLGAAGALGLKGLGNSESRQTVVRLEAVALWTEMLRDTLSGAAGLTQALIATAAGAPAAVAPDVQRLAAKLVSGVELETSLRELATDLGDPASDLVVAALVVACRERAQRLGDLLGALAAAIREEVAMRLGVEARRASSRTAVRMVSGFSMGFFGLMAVFARSYLSPYHGASGQLALAGVGLIFAAGLWMMAAMVRPRPLPRLVLDSLEETS